MAVSALDSRDAQNLLAMMSACRKLLKDNTDEDLAIFYALEGGDDSVEAKLWTLACADDVAALIDGGGR